jgi:hypothetical protein
MLVESTFDFEALYTRFHLPIAALDCGERCAPHNERGAPFCCDTQHVVPTAYDREWNYLRNHTDLWRPWQGSDARETDRLLEQAPEGQVLIACLGHKLCQREFRSITCRAFPFFPYLTREGVFTGFSYYWEFEDRCWVISNLSIVSRPYLDELTAAFETIFEQYPEERENYRQHSATMRRSFAQRRRAIPLVSRGGVFYKISPGNGRMRRVKAEELPKFGPYKVAEALTFADEANWESP